MSRTDTGGPANGEGLRHYAPLEPSAFQRLEHAPYLKGLLKPFKGKGDFEIWARQCQLLRDSLKILAQHVLAHASTYPFNLLPVQLAQQVSGAGTTFLRWRNTDRSRMGVALWQGLIASPATPLALVPDLYALECDRIALNMQVSLLHTFARQAAECASKAACAEAIYHRRLESHANPVTRLIP